MPQERRQEWYTAEGLLDHTKGSRGASETTSASVLLGSVYVVIVPTASRKSRQEECSLRPDRIELLSVVETTTERRPRMNNQP